MYFISSVKPIAFANIKTALQGGLVSTAYNVGTIFSIQRQLFAVFIKTKQNWHIMIKNFTQALSYSENEKNVNK